MTRKSYFGNGDAKGIPRDETARNDYPVTWLAVSTCKLGDMKKQASDQSFHDRRYQERKRAEAAKKVVPKKVAGEKSLTDGGKWRVYVL